VVFQPPGEGAIDSLKSAAPFEGYRAGTQAEADFLRDVADGAYTVESMMLAVIARAADLMEKYADLPLGTC
jgi:hypothetical protein